MFLDYLNGNLSAQDVAIRFARSTKDMRSKELILEHLSAGTPIDVGHFHMDFRKMVDHMMDTGYSPQVVNFLNNYLSASLDVISEDIVIGSGGTTSKWYAIKGMDTPWVEGVICANLLSFISPKSIGLKGLAKCKKCGVYYKKEKSYFVYCSESCKVSDASGLR